MNLEKVIFGFFVLLAATLNFGLLHRRHRQSGSAQHLRAVRRARGQPDRHGAEVRDRTQIGAVHLATSLVADLQLIAAGVVWVWADEISAEGLTAGPHGQRGLPVRRRAAGQPGLGGAAGDRDRHLPPRLKLGPPVSNPLLVFWAQLFGRREPVAGSRIPSTSIRRARSSSTIFVVMRRMRAPLITLIVIFSISVVGLTLIPGHRSGRPARPGWASSTPFYFMSYTATTIGFGELPWPFTHGQRLWVTVSIYLSVIGWAYAIGSLLTLLQDRSFRQALALQRFTAQGGAAAGAVPADRRLRPGRGAARQGLRRARPAARGDRRASDSRIDALDLESYHADIPGLAADAPTRTTSPPPDSTIRSAPACSR